MVETKPINKNSRRIFVPDRIFSCTSNGRLEIRGIFTDEQGNSAKSILIKIGHRTIACEQYQEGEFGISFSVSKGYKLIRVLAMTEKGKCVTIGTRFVKGEKEAESLSQLYNSQSSCLLPSRWFQRSVDGRIRIKGIFRDKSGKQARTIVAILGRRRIPCRQRNGNEFHFSIKVGEGLKLVWVYAITEEGNRVCLGSRLSFVRRGLQGPDRSRIPDEQYRKWIKLHEKPTPDDAERIESLLDESRNHSRFTIIINGKSRFSELLSGAVNSIRLQLYERWEMLVTESPSKTSCRSENYREKLEHRLPNDKNCANAIQYNHAATEAKGDYLIFLEPQDRLPSHCLLDIALALEKSPEKQLVYGDEDTIRLGGLRSNPNFKTDWDPVLLLSRNYIGKAFAIKTELFRRLGGFAEEQHCDPIWDLLLRAKEKLNGNVILHLPRIFLNRMPPLEHSISEANASNATEYQTMCKNRPSPDWRVSQRNGICRMFPPEIEPSTLISIVMPSACKLEYLKPCIESIFGKTNHPSFEIILVINEIRYTIEEQADYLEELEKHSRVRISRYPNQEFNYSSTINLGVADAKGDLLCLLNDDMEIISPDWLSEMAGWLTMQKTGAVGTRLLYPNETIQHAGITLGMNGLVDHVEKGAVREDAGEFGRIRFPRTLSCVTAGCMVLKKSVFEKVGGFDTDLAQAYNDIDFCLRLKQSGYNIIWTPFAEIYHHESASIDFPHSTSRKEIFREEMNLLLRQWGDRLREDPFYSPNYSNRRPYFSLAFPPRAPAPWKDTPSLSWDLRKPKEAWKGNIEYKPEKINVFSHFDLDNHIDEYVLHYLSELNRLGWVTVFVTSCSELSKEERQRIEPLTALILRSDGQGRDWGNFALGLRHAMELKPIQSLLLTNDSVYGPISSLEPFFEHAEKSEADFLGLTDSHQHRYHLQSYFLYCKPSLCRHQTFFNYWKAFIPQPDKDLIIENNEIEFSQHFINLSFRPEAFYAYQSLKEEALLKNSCAASLIEEGHDVNPSHYFWDVLLANREYPFIKIELIRDNPSKIPGLEFLRSYIKEKKPHIAEIIDEHLQRTARK